LNASISVEHGSIFFFIAFFSPRTFRTKNFILTAKILASKKLHDDHLFPFCDFWKQQKEDKIRLSPFLPPSAAQP